MRFLKKKINFLNNLYLKNANYSIDTWKLLNIERVLINLKENVYSNTHWYNFNLKFLNKPLLNFLCYIYILNFNYTIKNYSFLYFNNLLSQKNLEFLKKIYFFNFYFFINNIKNQFMINLQNYLKSLFTNNIKTVLNFHNKINCFNHKLAFFKILIIKKNSNFLFKYKNNIFAFKPLTFYNNMLLTPSLLKKNKIYTKNKYSRSRQYCKNIVLFGLLLNIILMFGLNSSYYAILLNSSYLILLFYVFLFFFSIFLFKKFNLLSRNTFI